MAEASSRPETGWREKARLARQKDFARAQQFQFIAQLLFRIRSGKLGGAKLAGGKIQISQPDGHPGIASGDRGQKTIFLGLEDVQIGGRAGRDDADHFAAYQLLAGAGLLHLIADSDFVTGAQQPGNIGFRGVKGDAAHGDGFAALAIARGEGNLQFFGGDQGVFVEKLVEVPQTKQEQRLGIALLDRLILPHQRRRGFYHSRPADLAGPEYTSRRCARRAKQV